MTAAIIYVLILMGPNGRIITQEFPAATQQEAVHACDQERVTALDEALHRHRDILAFCGPKPKR